jgi:hypothetical protein
VQVFHDQDAKRACRSYATTVAIWLYIVFADYADSDCPYFKNDSELRSVGLRGRVLAWFFPRRRNQNVFT